LVSRISGDVLTMRRDGTVDFLHQLINGHLACGHFRPEEFVEELSPAHARDQRALALGDAALAIELDRGRQPQFSGGRLRRRCQRLQGALWQLDREGARCFRGANDVAFLPRSAR
jgi:hypothetical protein